MPVAYVSGYDSKDSTTAPDVKEVVSFVAGGAIPVGSIVAASTADTGGQTVIVCSTALATAQLMEGVYNGVGGTGALATTTGLNGRAAVTGDVINVIKEGIVAMRFAAQTIANAVTFGTVKISPSAATAGLGQESTTTAPIVGNLWQTLTGGGTTQGTEIVITARVKFR